MLKLNRTSRILLIAGIACATAAMLTAHLRQAPPNAYDAQIQQLEHELSVLSKATPANAKRAKDHLAEVTNSLWTEDRLAEWAASFPKGWLVHELGTPEPKSVTLRRFSIERPQASFEHWHEIRSTMERLSAQPGLALRTVSISPDTRPSRNFRKVLFIATIAFPLPVAASDTPTNP